jgi:hypothetical protein
MTKRVFSKIALTVVAALLFACSPNLASASRSKGSHGGGGFHGGSSHGAGSSHGGGHTSFSGGGHSYRGSRGKALVSSGRMSVGRANSGQFSAGSYTRPRGFSSRPSGNFARNSDFDQSQN